MLWPLFLACSSPPPVVVDDVTVTVGEVAVLAATPPVPGAHYEWYLRRAPPESVARIDTVDAPEVGFIPDQAGL